MSISPSLPKLYGADWCPDCRRAKTYLKDNNIEFDFVDVDLNESATKLVERINNGKRIIPTITHLGKTFTNPDNPALADLFGINEEAVVRLYGADWCPDCRRAKRHLLDHDVRFEFVDVDAHNWAAEEVERINNGKRIIPTVIINGAPHSNPDNQRLNELLKLGLKREHRVYDVIIIGGGAAGLTASIYAQRDRFDTLILEKSAIGGNAFLTEKIENYPGFVSITGPELMDRMEKQATTYGATIKTGIEVTDFTRTANHFTLNTNGGIFEGRSIVLATGSTYRRLDIPGENELIGSGVHFCATCDGAFYRDREVIVIGGGNSALEEGIFLTNFTSKVKLVHRSPNLSADAIYTEKLPGMKEKLELHLDHTPIAFETNEEGKFKGLRIRNNQTNEEVVVEADGAFIFIGQIPNTKSFEGLIDLNERGFITTTGLAKTSMPGVFAAGDVRENAIAQVAAATGEGVLASYGLREYLKGLV
jgi:thioredoxin reductase (NADPH)